MNKSLIEFDEKTLILIMTSIFQKCEKSNSKDSSIIQYKNTSFSQILKMRIIINYHYTQDKQRDSAKQYQDLQGK